MEVYFVLEKKKDCEHCIKCDTLSNLFREKYVILTSLITYKACPNVMDGKQQDGL